MLNQERFIGKENVQPQEIYRKLRHGMLQLYPKSKWANFVLKNMEHLRAVPFLIEWNSMKVEIVVVICKLSIVLCPCNGKNVREAEFWIHCGRIATYVLRANTIFKAVDSRMGIDGKSRKAELSFWLMRAQRVWGFLACSNLDEQNSALKQFLLV